MRQPHPFSGRDGVAPPERVMRDMRGELYKFWYKDPRVLGTRGGGARQIPLRIEPPPSIMDQPTGTISHYERRAVEPGRLRSALARVLLFFAWVLSGFRDPDVGKS